MTGHDIIVVGASAGGVEAIPQVLGALPENLPASVFVVMHVAPYSLSLLPKIIATRAKLPAKHAENGKAFERSHIYVAPPDFHLILQDHVTRLVRGPKENRHRPSVDPLFRSAAKNFGPRVIGVILTGGLDDGTQGLHAIKQCGGIAIVQHPEEAVTPNMPLSAIRNVAVDHILPLAQIGPLLEKLTEERVTTRRPKECAKVQEEVNIMQENFTPEEMTKRHGPPSIFICPDCNGPLWETKVGQMPHYACFNGHAYSPESLLAQDSDEIERALWVAVKTLQERGALLDKMAAQAEKFKHAASATQFRQRAKEHRGHAETIRGFLDKAVNGVSSDVSSH